MEWLKLQYERGITAARRTIAATVYAFAGLGVFYVLQMTEMLHFINVAIPQEVTEALPKAAIVKSK